MLINLTPLHSFTIQTVVQLNLDHRVNSHLIPDFYQKKTFTAHEDQETATVYGTWASAAVCPYVCVCVCLNAHTLASYLFSVGFIFQAEKWISMQRQA